ncbi:MAG: hypothetical protein Q8M95_06855 [Candidatus Methanoperedens sp.]|nr:hypothetical protein [Candidatus Methanoperedens sp.]
MEIIEPSQKIPTKVRFVYKKPEEYQTHFANGAYGAINPRGDFEFHFFFEHRDMPEEEIMSVEEGKLMPEEQNLTNVTIMRDFKVGIIMMPEQAENLGKWLLNTIDEYKKKTENIKD